MKAKVTPSTVLNVAEQGGGSKNRLCCVRLDLGLDSFPDGGVGRGGRIGEEQGRGRRRKRREGVLLTLISCVRQPTRHCPPTPTLMMRSKSVPVTVTLSAEVPHLNLSSRRWRPNTAARKVFKFYNRKKSILYQELLQRYGRGMVVGGVEMLCAEGFVAIVNVSGRRIPRCVENRFTTTKAALTAGNLASPRPPRPHLCNLSRGC
ncbi:unnamed protein product [Pleuronectes platessa]|uniref:Uncharacterized protein n=1 Tax=Pleuronectes platessa TaxID=8262 RepID=A0A9N7UMA6_PLEPL|nr:unnamed protein product [Pleuronectes platessa]